MCSSGMAAAMLPPHLAHLAGVCDDPQTVRLSCDGPGGGPPRLRRAPVCRSPAVCSREQTPMMQQSSDVSNDRNETLWTTPPTSEDGEPIWVDMRINIDRLRVDTVQLSAYIKVALVMHWSDPRMVGWSGSVLPPTLWGPWPGLTNDISVTAEQAAFVLKEPDEGRLKRVVLYTGQASNPMDLRDFPMDVDSIDLDFVTSSHWKTWDRSLGGGRPKGISYRLRKTRPDEGKWLRLGWCGSFDEWTMHGVSTRLHELPPNANGAQLTFINISAHLSRNSLYYFWCGTVCLPRHHQTQRKRSMLLTTATLRRKALFPLYLLTALSFTTFDRPTDDAGIGERYSIISTYFLAAFPILYIVGESCPKTNFLTLIDRIILMTTSTLALNGAATTIIGKVHLHIGESQANLVNFWMGLTMFLLYIVTNILIFSPPFLQRRAARNELDNSSNHSDNPLHEEGEQSASEAKHLDPSHWFHPMSELAPGAVSSKPPGAHRTKADRAKADDKKNDSCPTESQHIGK
eukprot:COSAG01_NODE_5441_length_4262_cov_66.548883_2_plen_516_part_00